MVNTDQSIVAQEPTHVWLGLGANLGNRQETLLRSLSLINSLPETAVVALSSLYETEPVGERDQPLFLNCVVEITTRFSPRQLLRELKRIEVLLGRQHRQRWREREIDIDILIYGEAHINETDLHIPHPELHKRGFVLVPLAELAPDLLHPLLGCTVHELLHKLGQTDDIIMLKDSVEVVNSSSSTDSAAL